MVGRAILYRGRAIRVWRDPRGRATGVRLYCAHPAGEPNPGASGASVKEAVCNLLRGAGAPHDAHVKAWQSHIPENLERLARFATQPVLPPPYPSDKPEHFKTERQRREYISARRREKAKATGELIAIFRGGVRHPYLTQIIDLMMRGVILADDPEKALHSLLFPEVGGAPPGDSEETEFEIAKAVARRLRRKANDAKKPKTLGKIAENMAAALTQKRPACAKTEATIQRYYYKHKTAAEADLSLQALERGSI